MSSALWSVANIFRAVGTVTPPCEVGLENLQQIERSAAITSGRQPMICMEDVIIYVSFVNREHLARHTLIAFFRPSQCSRKLSQTSLTVTLSALGR